MGLPPSLLGGTVGLSRRRVTNTHEASDGADVTPRVLKILYGSDRARRVLIVERAEGHFSLQVERRYRNIFEGRLVAAGWQRLPGAPSVFQTVDVAEQEARSRFPWLSPEPQSAVTTISTNEQLLDTLQRLVEAWCDRRCLRALRDVLAGYPLPSPHTDGWGALYEALRRVRASDRDELTDAEVELVDDLIAAVAERLFRR